jgi:hypothetical protein
VLGGPADDTPVGFVRIVDEVGSPDRSGFEQTGEMWSDDEVLLRLKLRS